MDSTKTEIYRRYVKLPLDVLLSLLAMIILFPIFLFIAFVVRVHLGSPIFFTQQRPGLNGTIFKLYKFRTMTNERNDKGELLPDHLRLTKFGLFLRSTSLDELPELLNILKGDMSFIGPRPLLVEYLPYYTEQEQLRHSVRPGLSGLAQINGRSIASWEQRLHYDLVYVKNITFLGDLKIILKTIIKTIQRSDIGEPGVNLPTRFDHYRENLNNNKSQEH